MQNEYQDDLEVKNSLQWIVQTARSNTKRGAISMTDHSWKSFLTKLNFIIQSSPLQATIALHVRKILVPFFKGAADLIPYLDLQKQMHQFISRYLRVIIQKIYINSFQCLLQQEDEYRQLFGKGPLKAIVGEQGSPNNFLKEDKNTMKIKKLLISLNNIAATSQNFKMRKDLNTFVQNQLLILEPNMALEEICLNYIKRKVEIIQNQNPSFLCCRVHFQRYTSSDTNGTAFGETSNQEFKDYYWPLDNKSIIHHLTKTFVGFLNTTGGIIYVGLKEDKNKIVEVKGIELSNAQKERFLYFIHDQIMNNVYPKETDREEYDRKDNTNSQAYKQKLKHQLTREKSPETGYEYRIGTYVSVDFLDVFDGETYLNSIGQKRNRLYIVRIKIKAGNPQELYHLINSHQIPEAYIREDKSVKKKDIKEFYDLFYKRISGAESQQFQAEKKDPHGLCRFVPNILNKVSFM